MTSTLILLCIGLSAVAQPGSSPKYTLEIKKSKRVEAILYLSVHCPNVQAREWLAFASPLPEMSGQSEVSTEMEPTARLEIEKGDAGRSLLVAQIRVQNGELRHRLNLKVTYMATLYSRRLRPLAEDEKPADVKPLSVKERQLALQTLPSLDFEDGDFKAWLDANQLRPKANESTIDFARRVFLHIRSKFTYDYSLEMDRRASKVCTAGKSDCGGLSILFSAILRANKIPARTLYGRWAISAKSNEKINGVPYTQGHAIAEFYADQVGWIPVDLASSILHDRSDEGLQYFGAQAGNFITQHIDPDIKIETARFGMREVHGLQRPAYMVFGGGSLQGTEVNECWEVKVQRERVPNPCGDRQ